MSSWSVGQVTAGLIAAGLLLLADLALSIALLAVAALSRVTLRRLSTEGGPGAAMLERLKEPDNRDVAAAGILRQFCLLGATMLLVIVGLGSSWPLAPATGAALAGLLGAVLFEGILARGVALWNPRSALKATAFTIRLAGTLLFPVVAVLGPLLRWVGKSQRMSEEQREEEQDEQMEALIEVGERAGLLEAQEGEMMRGIVDLDETPVREIMTPRTDIVALSVEATVAEARGTIQEAGHSRVPVYRESIDNVVGVLHSRDLFTAWEEKNENEAVARYLRAPTFVPESLSAGALLTEMRQKSHLAMVVDEYGGIAGLVTLEDLLEEIVGEIRDEHEDEEDLVRKDKDGSYVINAATHVDQLETLFGVEFEERSFDTVGGFVVFGFGRVPSAGEKIQTKGLQVEVLEAEKRRVLRVRINAVAGPEEVPA